MVERLPPCAFESSPVERLWCSLKAVAVANLTSPRLAKVIDQSHEGVDDYVRRTLYLAYSFLRHTDLSVS